MKHPGLFLLLALLLVCVPALCQEELPARHLVSVQPTVSLNSLLPGDWTGVAAQYEYLLSPANSLTLHALWFRTPFTPFVTYEPTGFSLEGVAFAGEFRIYFSGTGAGWHIGPFGEWSFYKLVDADQGNYGPRSRQSTEWGVYAGHKWVRGNVTFDLSVRSAMYSRNEPFAGGRFFPQNSSFNSHLLISLGYAFR